MLMLIALFGQPDPSKVAWTSRVMSGTPISTSLQRATEVFPAFPGFLSIQAVNLSASSEATQQAAGFLYLGGARNAPAGL